MTALAAEGVTVRIGPRLLLREVSLSIGYSDVVGVIGPNGAGKTTLLKVLAGLVRPERGKVLLGGTELRCGPGSDAARALAYLAQGAVCHWPLTVEQVVMLGRLPHAGSLSRVGTADRAAVERALEEADLGDFRHRRVDTLSAGERSRVMLARALGTEPQLLLADEPIAALDPGHQLDVMVLMRRLAERGAGVVLVLHDLTLASRFCQRLVLLHRGRVVAAGRPDQVLTEPLLANTYGVEARLARVGDVLAVMPWRRLPSPCEERSPDGPDSGPHGKQGAAKPSIGSAPGASAGTQK